MAKEFTYFAGTLPMLFFGEKPAVSLEAFDEDAARLTDAETAELLRKVTLYTEDTAAFPAAVKKFYDWENSLRNSLLDLQKKVRPDAGDFKRNNPDFYSEIAIAANQALRHRHSTIRICWKQKKLSTVCAGRQWIISVQGTILILPRWHFTV